MQVSEIATGAIYLARDKVTSERVSVFKQDKSLLSSGSKELLSRRDARIIRGTQTHPRTLSVIDVFETSSHVNVVTELVNGGTLQSLVETNLPLAVGDVAKIGHGVLDALGHLHELGIVHGAVDAHHVLIARRPSVGEFCVKLAVFGIATHIHEGDVEGFTLRSRRVQGRAPEVVCFQQRSAASDVFECGVLMFKLMTGIMPFPAQTDTEYLSKVSLGPSGVAWTTIPHDLQALLRNMLRDDPGQRPTAIECLKNSCFGKQSESLSIAMRKMVDTDEEVEGDCYSGGDSQRTLMTWHDDNLELARVESDPKSVMVGISTFDTEAEYDSGA